MFIDPIYLVALLLVSVVLSTTFFVVNKINLVSSGQKKQIESFDFIIANITDKLDTMSIEISLVKKELYKVSSKKNSTLKSAQKLSLSIAKLNE